jgi:hypothetical protein
MKYFLYFGGLILCLAACQEAEDARPMSRNTFARFYESGESQEGVAALPFQDGYILLASRVTPSDTTGLVIRTNSRGDVLWTTNLHGIIPRSLQTGQDAFFVFGDSIHVNPESEVLDDLIIHSALLYKIGFDGTPGGKLAIADPAATNRIDYRANAITLNEQNELILLGTFRSPGLTATERPFVAALGTTGFDTLWIKNYNIIDRDYVNARSVHCTTDGYVIWASAILKEQQSFERTYLSIPLVKENSVFENSDVFGATTDQKLLAGDIQPAAITEFGYGIIGTYASPAGDNSNMFFGRITSNGNFIAGSERFFDGQHSSANVPVTLLESASQDTGDVLCATSDGGWVLAGTMTTTPLRGNGGKDIFLVKVDAMGNIQWNRVMGGTGDETISGIRETEDGGLLLCGSKDASGLPAIFLIKTNPYGVIED